jgi:hypothetical protein
MVVLSDCIECEHFCDDGNPHTCCCKAYPDGIPRKWYLEGRPREVKQCNNGIGFKPECNEDLDMDETLNHPKLGKLEYLESPEQIHCWHGKLEGSELGFDIILETSKLDEADADFIAKIIQNWKSYEAKAIEDIREKLTSEPKFFGISKEDAERLSKQNSLPFGCPQFTFYENKEWAIVFLENDLDIGEPFGISVNYDGEMLTGVYDLSDAEEIDW